MKRLLKGTKQVSEASMRKAADEAVDANDGINKIAASFDGRWQKRGHTSMTLVKC